MISYLLKTLVMLIFSAIIIYYYYLEKAHVENFDGYSIYLGIVFVIYGMHKIIQVKFKKTEISFMPIEIFLYFFVHLIVLSILFFYYNNLLFWSSFGDGLALSFKILFYSLLPIVLVLIPTGFGQFTLSKILSYYNEKSVNYKLITGIGFGIFLFIFILTLVGILGFYNLYSVFGILIIFSIISYKELARNIIGIFNYKIKCTKNNFSSDNFIDKVNLKLLSTEFFFIIITLLLSINLISIFRPFPIGWDDLGAYMNYAHLMANDGSIGFLGSMMSWQTFTGIGYMFNNPTLAFFINNIGGFVSVILITLIISEIFKNKEGQKDKKETFINLPLLASTIFISMPMVVFQQAKDMKLDAGLFFISIVALYMLFEFYNNYKKGGTQGLPLQNIDILKLFGIIGLLLGFAFTIKFTSLLLISAVIGVLFFTRLGILGFLGYLSIYFAIFTLGGLWKMMNVVGLEKSESTTNLALMSCILGIAFLVTARVKTKKRFRRFIPRIIALFVGILIAVSPWAINNINQAGKVGVSEILSGKSERFIVDYSKIYSEKEIAEIENKTESLRGISSSGTTTNEDFGRYFGYEKGINNYVKLPWNLTMQKNQGGEFTDIGFLFLALLPVLLLFLPFRKKYVYTGIILLLILELLIFVKTDNNLINKSEISSLEENVKVKYFTKNNYVLQDKKFNKDIYDIDFSNYILEEDIINYIETNDNIKNEIKELSKKQKNNDLEKIYNEKKEDLYYNFRNAFYNELKEKILNNEINNNLKFINKKIIKKDLLFLEEIGGNYNNYYIFKNKKIQNSEKVLLSENEISEDNIIKIWKKHRTINQFITDVFSKIPLPFGYLILSLFFLPILLLLTFLQKEDLLKIFKINLIFTIFYTFLWAISAFGIVWYGIVMYFNFILLIIFGAYYLVSYSSDSELLKEGQNPLKYKQIKFFGTLVFLTIIFIYIFFSVFPHTFNNLKKASFENYKKGNVTISESPFLSHSEYLPMLFNLNIDEEKKYHFIENSLVGDDLKDIFKKYKIGKNIISAKGILYEIIKSKEFPQKIKLEARKSLQNIYSGISNPKEEFKNKVGIYRIGTFLKYHISENNNRLYEDSLLNNFDKYFYSENPDITVDRMSKIGIKYFLVDLNAATIDQDPRHNLTKRYEKLLQTFTSKKLELIETDSICLKIGLENYGKEKNIETYTYLSGVNYNSYNDKGGIIGKNNKRINCYKSILRLFNANQINQKNYNYLLPLKSYLEQIKTENEKLVFLSKNISPGYKVLFKIK